MSAAFEKLKASGLGGRLWHAVPLVLQVAVGLAACTLWLTVASPGLRLLPGVGSLSDPSVEIALQSAMLGIDDGSSTPTGAVLGGSYLRLPSGAQLRTAVGTRLAAITVESGSVRLVAAASPATSVSGSPIDVVATPQDLQAWQVPAAQAPPAPVAPGAAEPAPPSAPPSGDTAPVRTATPAPGATPAPTAPAVPELLEQRIELDTSAAVAYVGHTVTVSATASSTLPVSLAVRGGAGICTLSASSLRLRAAGTCTVEARQPGNAKYREARAEQSVTVVRAPQSIAFTTTAPADAVVGDPDYAVAAAATSGLPVRLSVVDAAVCDLRGGSVHLRAPGLCTIEARQAGDAATEPAATAGQSFQVRAAVRGQSSQTIAFTSAAPSSAVVGGAAYHASAHASSGLPVELAADSAGVCAITGTVVTFSGEGTCTITARQAGDDDFLAAADVQQSFAVSRAAQAVSFLSTPPASAVAGLTTYLVVASSSTSLPVTLSVPQTSATVCAISGAIVTAIAAGTCAIEADQLGDDAHQPAPKAVQTFSVGSAAPSLSVQSISFTSVAPAAATVGAADYALAASATSGLPVSFSAAAGSAGVCSVSGATVALVGAGTCTVIASQAGSAVYEAAADVQQSFTIGVAAQAISFTSVPPMPALAHGPDYAVGATASSGLPLSYSVAPASSGICAVSGATVSLLADGTCTVYADQAGDGGHAAAPRVAQSFTIGAGPPSTSPQSISFTSAAPASATTGGSYVPAASASSGLPVAFSVAPASAGVCTLSGSTVSLVAAGSCTVRADQPGNAGYDPAPQAVQSFTVSPPPPAPQTITFVSAAPTSAVFGATTSYTVAASAGSGLPVAFSAPASSAGVCAVSGASVSLTGAGTCTVAANQAGNASFAAAPQAQQSFTVARAPQTITITSTPPAVDKHSAPYTIAGSSSSGLAVSFSIAPESAAICTASGAAISFLKKGDCVVNANQGGSTNYLPAPQVQQTIAVLAHA